jgi:hypothetical protein
MYLFRVLILAALLLTVGCIYSEHPLSPRESSRPDRSLVGLWRLQCEPGDVTYFHVFVTHRGDMKLVKVTCPGEKTTTAESVESFSFFPTSIKGKHFLNLEVPVPEEGTKKVSRKYMFFRYEYITRKKLEITTPSYEAAETSIKGNILRGKAWETTWGTNGLLTDTPEKLTDWLLHLDEGKGLERFGTLVKLE